MVKTIQCLALVAKLGDKVSFPGSDVYSDSVSSYFAQQEAQLSPGCIVSPTTAEDVAAAVRSLSETARTCDESHSPSACDFAIRSGGHSTLIGAANIADGVTMDLQGLNSIEVSDDRSTARVGPGARWQDVYLKLDALKLSVAGGRAATVGVGGLTTGGGISYFSPRYGWTCDTVSNFEVVLADGSIVNANEKENPELLVALRGGSNNLGIVTRVDLDAFEQGLMLGGSSYHYLNTTDQNLKALEAFSSAEDYDEYASLITSFGFAAGQGAFVVNSLAYTKPVEKPEAYKQFMEIPSLQSTVRVSNLTDISIEQGASAPMGLRQLWVTITHGTSLPMLNATYLNWNSTLATIQDVPDLVYSMSLEPLPEAIYTRGATSNSLGLADRSGGLVVTLLNAMWSNEADDGRMEEAVRKLGEGIEAEAKRLGEYDSFVYLNYAAPWQDPIASYGEENVEKLKKVNEAVDSEGFLRKHVPGGFKIPY